MYVSVLGTSASRRRDSLAGLASAHGILQARIDRELSLRRTPQLTFAYDDAVERGVRMTKLIDDLAADLPEDDGPVDDDTRLTLRRSQTRSASTTRSSSVAHENPDGDALGSLLATTIALRELGKDVVMYLSGDAPTPAEFDFLDLERRSSASCRATSSSACCSPSTARTSTASAPSRAIVERAAVVLNVDHHHDNSRFGDVNLIVADASSTAEIVRDLLSLLDVRLTPDDRRGALRRRSSPTPAASSTRTRRRRRCGSPPSWSRRAPTSTGSSGSVYETVQFAKLKLLARALDRAQLYEGGRLLVSLPPAHRLRRGRRRGAVLGGDHRLPAPGVEGAQMVALIREPPRDDGRPDAPHLAPLEPGRGRRVRDRAQGRRRRPPAGGRLLERATRSTRSSSSSGASSSPRPRRRGRCGCRRERYDRSGSPCVDKPAGPSSFALVAELRRRTGRAHRPHRHARPVRDGPARAALGRGDAARALLRRARQAVRHRDRPDRDDVDRRSRGRDRSNAHAAPDGPSSTRRSTRLRGEVELPIPAHSAVKIGGERAYKLARRGVAVEMPLRRSQVLRARRRRARRRRR